MLPYARLLADLRQFAVGVQVEGLEVILRAAVSDRVHGKLPEWRTTLSQLPDIAVDNVALNAAVVSACSETVDPHHVAKLRKLLLNLVPWRKGPFNLFGIDIDTEWRSNLKWDRLSGSVSPLAGRRILDVGCGNGYYAMRARGQGAAFVLGIDPTLVFLMQFLAVQHYLRTEALHVLPLRLQDVPLTGGDFDTTFSMGVLYHQRTPLDHLIRLRDTLRPGGELVLETLILPGEDARHETPVNRYARMRNIWMLPTTPELRDWLARCGFADCRVADVSVTTSHEQRTTEWMPFESLDKALHQRNADLTIEGLPRPRRAVIIATRH